jgi:hypothetical protein
MKQKRLVDPGLPLDEGMKKVRLDRQKKGQKPHD